MSESPRYDVLWPLARRRIEQGEQVRAVQDLSGKRLSFAPQWTASLETHAAKLWPMLVAECRARPEGPANGEDDERSTGASARPHSQSGQVSHRTSVNQDTDSSEAAA